MVELQGNVAHPLLQQIYVNPVNMVLEQVKGSVKTNGVERKGDVQRSSSSSSSSSKRVEEPDVIDLAETAVLVHPSTLALILLRNPCPHRRCSARERALASSWIW